VCKHPHVAYTQTLSFTATHLIHGVFLAGLALAFLFSRVFEAVPLLPFVLGAAALYDLSRHINGKRRVDLMNIKNVHGVAVVTIARASCSADALREFQQTFSDSVRGSKALASDEPGVRA
jgi:hypothetical protein